MKIAIIIGAVILFSALCVVGLFLIRRTLYNMIDRRIERFQSELIEKQVHILYLTHLLFDKLAFRASLSKSRCVRYRICTVMCVAGGTITATISTI